MSRAKSQAQLQREYRDRLKSKDPELLRARDHEKYRRRCLKRKMLTHTRENVSVRRIKQADGPFVEAPHHDRASPVNAELKQDEIPACFDSTRNTDKSSARKLHLVDKTTCRNYAQQVDIAGTPVNRSTMEQDVASMLRNAELGENVKSFLIGILDSWIREKNIESESGVLPKHTHHENAERRKYAKKTISKKTTKRKNMDVKQRKLITWEPLYFDLDNTNENDE